MDVKPGYKLTEAGVIPEDWSVKLLAQCAQVRSGVAKNASVKLHDPIRVHYLRVANVQDGFLDLTEVSEIEIEKANLKRFSVLVNDVLMNEGGDRDKLGRGCIWSGEFDPCVHQNHVFVVRCTPELSPRYLTMWTRSAVAKQYFVDAGSQTTNLASINKTALGNLPIALPKKAEQETIAAALSDADAHIDALEQLAAKKRRIKHGAMQELLTGRTRLPGFSGDWEMKRLEEITDTDPENLGSDTPRNFAFNYISLEDVDCGTLQSFSEQVFHAAPSRARRRLRLNDVLVSTVRPNLLSHLFFNHVDGAWVCSTGFSVVRCRRRVSHPYFIFSQLFADGITRQVEALLTGSNYPAINSADVRALRIPTPGYVEQAAIAAVLSDMDAEVAAVENRVVKARQIKQGLAQELLTGRTRLV